MLSEKNVFENFIGGSYKGVLCQFNVISWESCLIWLGAKVRCQVLTYQEKELWKENQMNRPDKELSLKYHWAQSYEPAEPPEFTFQQCNMLYSGWGSAEFIQVLNLCKGLFLKQKPPSVHERRSLDGGSTSWEVNPISVV